MRVRWKNFRSFVDTGWLELRPLTVLIGANNTGKTSVYSPLLLLKQTLDARSPSPALITKGRLLDAGRYDDVVLRHRSKLDMSFDFQLDADDPIPTATYSAFTGPLKDAQPTGLGLQFTRGEDGEAALRRYVVRDHDGSNLLSRSRLASGRYSLSGFSLRPTESTGEEHPRVTQLRRRWGRVLRRERPINFLFTGWDTVSSIGDDFIQEDISETEVGQSLLSLYQVAIQYAALNARVQTAVRQLLHRVTYLGPLRATPDRWYDVSGDPPDSVGISGEFAAEMLYRASPELRSQVAEWLQRFELGRDVNIEETDRSIFSLSLRRTGRSPAVNIVDSGFGVSQLLPIIVEIVCAPGGNTLIAQQPEIHLNPKLQAELADLFVYANSVGRRAIVETHSEHFLMRLRRLIAQEAMDPKDVALYYTDRAGDTSRVRRVPISDNGQIAREHWPAGFFASGLDEAMGLASAQSARRKK